MSIGAYEIIFGLDKKKSGQSKAKPLQPVQKKPKRQTKCDDGESSSDDTYESFTSGSASIKKMLQSAKVNMLTKFFVFTVCI